MTDENTKTGRSVADCLPSDFAARAYKHFAKALRKHPRFADAMHGYESPGMVRGHLVACREIINSKRKCSRVFATDLLECELLEAWCAPNEQDTIDELYDAVAVLMRMIAVVEGKQRLGGEA